MAMLIERDEVHLANQIAYFNTRLKAGPMSKAEIAHLHELLEIARLHDMEQTMIENAREMGVIFQDGFFTVRQWYEQGATSTRVLCIGMAHMAFFYSRFDGGHLSIGRPSDVRGRMFIEHEIEMMPRVVHRTESVEERLHREGRDLAYFAELRRRIDPEHKTDLWALPTVEFVRLVLKLCGFWFCFDSLKRRMEEHLRERDDYERQRADACA